MDNTLLMLPGPVNVAPNVLAAMSKVFKTNNQYNNLTSSGTGEMEADI